MARGLYGFIWNKLNINHTDSAIPKDKLNSLVVTYTHDGGQPSWIGRELCQFIEENDKFGKWDRFKKRFKSLTFINPNKDKASQKEINQYKKFTQSSFFKDRDLSKWYLLLREIQGIETLEHILKGDLHHFLDFTGMLYGGDSRYVYILNLNNRTLELYQEGYGILSKNRLKIDEIIKNKKAERKRKLMQQKSDYLKHRSTSKDDFDDFVKSMMEQPYYFGFVGAYSFDKLPQKIEDIPNWDKSEAELREMYEKDLIKEFEKMTGKNAIWRGEITKQYLEWRDKKKNEPTIIQKLTKDGNTKPKVKESKEDVFIFNSTIKGKEESKKSKKEKNKKEASLEEYYDDITEDFLAIMRLYLMKEDIEPTEANLWKALDIFFKSLD